MAIVLIDQSAKWWAWGNLAAARINQGGDQFVGPRISSWFLDPTIGALLDLIDVGLLLAAFGLLLRRPRTRIVAISGTAMITGWSSNLLDRVGLHYLTAPGSVRGAVDFMHLGKHYYNLADLVIIAATPVFVVAVLGQAVRRANTRAGQAVRPSYSGLHDDRMADTALPLRPGTVN